MIFSKIYSHIPCVCILVHLNILDLPRPVEHKVTIDWALLNVHLTIGETESTNRVREWWGKVYPMLENAPNCEIILPRKQFFFCLFDFSFHNSSKIDARIELK